MLRGFRHQRDVIHPGCPLNFVLDLVAEEADQTYPPLPGHLFPRTKVFRDGSKARYRELRASTVTEASCVPRERS